MKMWITEAEMEEYEDFLWVDPETDCYLWQGSRSPNGYGVMDIGGKPISTHRLAWLLSRDEDPTGWYVCHTCDRKSCVNPDHLFLGTAKQNTEDAKSKGRFNVFRPSQRMVTKNELDEMVARYASGQTWYRIGKDMNRPQQHVKLRVEGVLYGDIFQFLKDFETRVEESEAAA